MALVRLLIDRQTLDVATSPGGPDTKCRSNVGASVADRRPARWQQAGWGRSVVPTRLPTWHVSSSLILGPIERARCPRPAPDSALARLLSSGMVGCGRLPRGVGQAS